MHGCHCQELFTRRCAGCIQVGPTLRPGHRHGCDGHVELRGRLLCLAVAARRHQQQLGCSIADIELDLVLRVGRSVGSERASAECQTPVLCAAGVLGMSVGFSIYSRALAAATRCGRFAPLHGLGVPYCCSRAQAHRGVVGVERRGDCTCQCDAQESRDEVDLQSCALCHSLSATPAHRQRRLCMACKLRGSIQKLLPATKAQALVAT